MKSQNILKGHTSNTSSSLMQILKKLLVIIPGKDKCRLWEHTHPAVISTQICKAMQEPAHKHNHFTFQFKVLFFIQLSF